MAVSVAGVMVAPTTLADECVRAESEPHLVLYTDGAQYHSFLM